MAGGRNSKASKPVRKRAGKKAGATSAARGRAAAKAANGKRTVVVEGTFSIEEIEVTGKSRSKAKGTGNKKSRKKVAKKVGKKPAKAAAPKSDVRAVTNDALPVVLARQSGIKAIDELRTALKVAHDTGTSIVVDAGDVESIDTAALQLLVAFTRATRDKAQTIEWKEPSETFREMADLADLSRHLGIGGDTATEEDDGLCPVF